MTYPETMKSMKANIDAYFDIRRAFDIDDKHSAHSFKNLVWTMGHDTDGACTSLELDGVRLSRPGEKDVFIPYVEIKVFFKIV